MEPTSGTSPLEIFQGSKGIVKGKQTHFVRVLTATNLKTFKRADCVVNVIVDENINKI